MRLLLVEDDKLLAEGIAVSLDLDGHTVDHVETGEHAIHAVMSESFDLMILDLGLPGISGYDALKQLRDAGKDIPILILTARDQVTDKVKGLDLGADDYLLKPFDVDELKARIRALLRRHSGRARSELRIGALCIYPEAHEVSLDEAQIKLSPKEFTILHELAMHQNRILSKDQLTELVYGWSEDPESNSIEVHIHNLRKKLGTSLIETVRGVGYRIGAA